MHSHDIERLLRLPAPDEPSVLPALVLPMRSTGGGLVRGQVRMSAAFGSGRSSIPVLIAIALLLAALVGLVATGTIRLDRLQNPFDGMADFRRNGVHLAYPDTWHELVSKEIYPEQIIGEQAPTELSTLAMVTNTPLAGCAIDDVKCFTAVKLPPGAIRIRLMTAFRSEGGSAIGVGPMTDTLPADGWSYQIDGMPARLDVEAQPQGDIADEIRRWSVLQPGSIASVWVVEAALRGPDLTSLRAQADRIANTMTFDAPLVALDEGNKAALLRRAVDDVDREHRWAMFSRFYGCFPRTEGAQEATISEGPDTLLARPVPVTCATSISRTAAHLWRIRLTVSWSASDGYAAGRWVFELWLDGNGQSVASAQGEGGKDGTSGLPEPPRETPPALTAPLNLPVGELVEILPPGGLLLAAPDPNDVSPADTMIGRHVYVLDGPRIVDGDEWYQVQWHAGGDASFMGWIRGTFEGRPILRPVEPACPSTADLDVPDLLGLTAAERVLCFGNEDLVIARTTVTLGATNPTTGEHAIGPEVTGTPKWLAEEPLWQLWGSAGTGSVDGPIRVSIDPALGTTLPTGGLLAIHGHFDDPASSTCQRTRLDPPEAKPPAPAETDGPYPSNGPYPSLGGIVMPGPEPESPALQVLRCREHFVITSVQSVAP
jgi:hypothetical protein